ncbi:hypothetical protein AK830_g4889 [Neonectria ditissima]|uniref:Heterokaryon incompatibility domain-containing protein n=1 Tax=Neonectria ditissima TaxID=78410 RepID=A0A0N8H7F7_9HYPO|nr:hypothetical protein AK830_g4889 [Neonectria ditissima]
MTQSHGSQRWLMTAGESEAARTRKRATPNAQAYAYWHKPIYRESSEIRLVRFIQPKDQAAPIQLELCHTSLNDTQYAALSYVWGDVTDTVQISIDNHSFAIGHNLHAGLKQLRDNGFRSWLWVDSICIQQADPDEKTWQVEHMGSGALVVFIWLGSGSDESDKVMDFVSRVGPRALTVGVLDQEENKSDYEEIRNDIRARISAQRAGTDGDTTGSDLALFLFDLLHEPGLRSNRKSKSTKLDNDSLDRGILNIMRRDYWHRIWIVQEVSLAEHATVLCGDKSVSLDIFDASFEAVLRCWRMRKSSDDTDEFGSQLTGRVRLSDIVYQTTVAPKRPFYSATDPRDIVFGLLGVVTDGEQLGLHIDYNLTFVEVFTAMTRALINDSDSWQFQLDSCVPRHTNPDCLPSWVPDWREMGKYGVGVYPINHSRSFDATAGLRAPSHVMGSSDDDKLGVLRRPGCQVDVVTQVMQPPRWVQESRYMASQVGNTEAWLTSIIEFVKLGPKSAPGEDYVWRTIMLNDLHRYAGTSDLHNGYFTDEEIASLVRQTMRRENIDARLLTESQKKFVDNNIRLLPGLDTLEDKLADFAYVFPDMIGRCGRERTLFKTMKGMFGLGHVTIREGDIVTLLWGLDSPIILRKRDDSVGGGFEFVGDAYVDQIMYGEFLETSPAHRVFDIY